MRLRWLMTAVNQNNKSGKFQTQMTSDMESIMLPYFLNIECYNEWTLVQLHVLIVSAQKILLQKI